MAEEQGWLDRLASHVGERLSAIPSEVGQYVTDKFIPQGASEIAQALNSQADGYVPYGSAQTPLEVEGPQMSYQDMLKDASQRGGQEQDMGIER